MEIAKALILAGDGVDQRPWPTAAGTPRHLFPLANRPILLHNLESLRAAGVLQATILTEPGGAPAIERTLGDGRRLDLRLSYAEWRPSSGLHGALRTGRDFVGDEPVLVQRGDAILRDRMHGHIATFARERLDAMTLRLCAPAPGAPSAPAPGHLLSARAVAMLVDTELGTADNPTAGVEARGGRVRIQDVEGALPCLGDQDALLAVNRTMLEELVPSAGHDGVDACVVQGPVEIHPTARVSRSTLRGPAIIGPHARITDAYVGPYTSIGAGVVMEGAEIEHSIVLPEAELRFVGTRLESCVIGRGARVIRTFQPPAALRLSIGEGAEIHLS
jgi:glucose-1-phosphate thymidylyltransferase